MKKALITGIAGQDGSYLSEILLSKGYEVFGLAKKGTDMKYVPKRVRVISGDMTDFESLKAAVREAKPDRVYNLAGITDLKTAYEKPELTMKVNCEAVGVLLAEALAMNPQARFLQASSSLVFLPSSAPLSENSPLDSRSTNPYVMAKVQADKDIIQSARKEENAFACSAFLFNHESPRRPETSAGKKITTTLAKISLGMVECLRVGNLADRRDFGFAGDYAQALCEMLELPAAEDLVIASGEPHSILDIVTISAAALGMKLKWHGEGINSYATDESGAKRVAVDPTLYRPAEPEVRIGDTAKAQKMLGWKPKVDFTALILMMTEAARAELSR